MGPFPLPPHSPSLSDIAETAITPGILAGEVNDVLILLFPAATTYINPFERDSLIGLLNLFDGGFSMLKLTISISSECSSRTVCPLFETIEGNCR